MIDENGKENALFSGDTLFIGDVGRPDLAQKAATMTQEQLAATLYHSLRTKIMVLPDDVLVYPAHGAGSACGKNMSKETFSTIGVQKQLNYALRANMTETEFVEEVTDGLLPAPAYFGMNVAMNKNGYESFEKVFANGMKAIELSQFEIIVEANNALILDTRNSGDFALGFVPQAINIGINGDFAPWVGAMIGDVKQAIILVTEVGKEEETVTRLTRVGFDNILGHLKGGFEAWKNAGKDFDKVNRITADQFNDAYFTEISIEQHLDKDGDFGRKRSKIIDVRKIGEYEAEHIEEAYFRPLANINEWIKDINPNEHFYLHCAGGYRSMIAASILQARGYRNFTEIEGGFNAIAKTTVPKSNFMCQSKI